MRSFFKKLEAKDADSVYSFLRKTATDPAAGSFRGKLYERFVVIPRARDKPREGFIPIPNDLKLQRLDKWTLESKPPLLAAAKLDLPAPLPIERFKGEADLEVLSGGGKKEGMYIPLSPEFSAIDLVWIIGGQPILVNATVSDSHDIRLNNPRFLAV
jgi:hypothetical protein